MTDRELLELAAKVAGIDYYHQDSFGNIHEKKGGTWNPLTDDGDALCLAVKLNMNFYTGYRHVSAEILSDSDEPSIFITIRHGDPYAATRRAIVRAAAEIGKEQK